MDTAIRTSAGIILAGGKSSRMGRDKAFLKWRGKTFLEHAQLILKRAGVQHIYVSGEYDGDHIIPDAIPNLGPVGGICSAIQKLASRHDSFVFLSIDMPCIKPDLIITLFRQSPSLDACFYKGNFLPCLIRSSEAIANYAHQYKAPISLRTFLHCLNFHELPIIDEKDFFNINTPEQLKEISDENSIPF